MAIISTPSKLTANMALDDGLGPTGAQKSVNCSLGTMNPNAWDAQKAWNIATAFNAGLLSKTLMWINKVATDKVEED